MMGGKAPTVNTRLDDRRGIVVLAPSDLTRVKALHDNVLAEPQTATLYVHRDYGFFSRHLGSDGHILGFFDRAGGLVGYSVLGLPQADGGDNLGYQIDLAPPRRARVAHLDGTCIRPAWRGQGLQRRFTAERIALARQHGRSLLLATCQPDNHWSLANLFSTGLTIVAYGRLHQKPRLILRRDLDRAFVRQTAGAPPQVALDDLDGHREALADGWLGTGLARDGNGLLRVVYAGVQADGTA